MKVRFKISLPLSSVEWIGESGVSYICRAGCDVCGGNRGHERSDGLRWFAREEVRGLIERNEILDGLSFTGLSRAIAFQEI